MKEYITESSIRIQEQLNANFIYGNKFIFVKDKLPDNVDLNFVARKVEALVPQELVYELDGIYIGQFQELLQREVEAITKDGVIYVTNEHEDATSLVEDIIHECGHIAEQRYQELIYGDGELQNEFMSKRRRSAQVLYAQGYDIPADFADPAFSSEVDNFLYGEVGYERVDAMLGDMFLGGYAVTSLREYFSTAFESYYCNPEEREYLKQTSPVLYNKLEELNSV